MTFNLDQHGYKVANRKAGEMMDYNPIVADVDHWIRNNCASWSTEAVIVALVQLGYINMTKVMEWLQEENISNKKENTTIKSHPFEFWDAAGEYDNHEKNDL